MSDGICGGAHWVFYVNSNAYIADTVPPLGTIPFKTLISKTI